MNNRAFSSRNHYAQPKSDSEKNSFAPRPFDNQVDSKFPTTREPLQPRPFDVHQIQPKAEHITPTSHRSLSSNLENISVFAPGTEIPPPIHAKLTIGQPNDRSHLPQQPLSQHLATENSSASMGNRVIQAKLIKLGGGYAALDEEEESIINDGTEKFKILSEDDHGYWLEDDWGEIIFYDTKQNRRTQERLGDLLMNTGSLGEMKIEEGGWENIAKELKKDFLPYQKSLDPKDQASYVANLCTMYVSNENGWWKKDSDDAQYTKQVPNVENFIQEFMNRNGQMAYIEEQPWYKSGDYVIGIDVNYYPDRSGFKDALRFHKDTGGNNIFVNLIFDNQTQIEATEWFADVEEPSQKRKKWQSKLLPPEHLDELARTRQALRYGEDPTRPVSGGVSKGKNTYVSWVDDLIWHSTPQTGKRVTTNAKEVMEWYDKYPDFDKHWYELLLIIAENSNTKLAKYLKKATIN